MKEHREDEKVSRLISGWIFGDTSGMETIFASVTHEHPGIVPSFITVGTLVESHGVCKFLVRGISLQHRGRCSNLLGVRISDNLGVSNRAKCIESLLTIGYPSRENIIKEQLPLRLVIFIDTLN